MLNSVSHLQRVPHVPSHICNLYFFKDAKLGGERLSEKRQWNQREKGRFKKGAAQGYMRMTKGMSHATGLNGLVKTAFTEIPPRTSSLLDLYHHICPHRRPCRADGFFQHGVYRYEHGVSLKIYSKATLLAKDRGAVLREIHLNLGSLNPGT